jgi:hypothetical protein
MNENMVQVIALLEKAGKEALNQAFNEATREAFCKATESRVKSVSNDSLSSTASMSIGTFISKFTQAFLEIFYGMEERPRGIEVVVSALVREPLITGLEQLRMANETVSFSEKGMQYRVERFRNALCSLDRARSLASEEFEIAFINFLRGLCAFELPGGTSEALVHLTSFQVWANKEAEHLFLVKEEKQRKAERLDVEIEELKYLLKLKPANGPLYLALQEAQNRVQCLRAEIDEITLLEGKVMDTCFYMSALFQVAQRIMIDDRRSSEIRREDS